MAQAPVEVATVGDRVLLTDKKKGEIGFIGEVDGKKGTFYGIILDDAVGKNNGSVGQISYFTAEDKHGLFIHKDKIHKTKPGPNSGNSPRVTVGSKVHVNSKQCNGSIMFIGPTDFKEGIWYGVKLDKPNGKNNGSAKGRKYFRCKDKHGTFVQASQISLLGGGGGGGKRTSVKSAHIKSKSKTSKTSHQMASVSAILKDDSKDKKDDSIKTEPKSPPKSPKKEEINFEKGDKVMVKPNKKGQIRWMGEDKAFNPGVWYGIRLEEKRGTCDGEWKDVRHFTCPKDYGVFVQKKDLISKLDDSEAKFDFMEEEVKYQEEKEAVEAEFNAIKAAKKSKMTEIKEHFRKADKDGDFDIDKEEWAKMSNELWPDLTKDESEKLFAQIDITQSGEISFAEFTAHVEKVGGIDGFMKNPMKDPSNENTDNNDINDANDANEDEKSDDNNNENNDDPAKDASEDNNNENNENNEENDASAIDEANDEANEEVNEEANEEANEEVNENANEEANDAGNDEANDDANDDGNANENENENNADNADNAEDNGNDNNNDEANDEANDDGGNDDDS